LCEVLFTDNKGDIAAHKARNAQLFDHLMSLNYQVRQLIKSSDDQSIIDARLVEEFPSAFWSQKNKDLCDYLFIPKEKESESLEALLAK
jgi:hypothetical protein